MQALHRQFPSVHFELFTEVPEWFFQNSLACSYTYNRVGCDVGLAQVNPFEVDPAETIRRLERLFADRNQMLGHFTGVLKTSRCRLILCDIAFLGIEAAEILGIPSILIENFTWDFIYAGYSHLEPKLEYYAGEIKKVFDRVPYHIQSTPICEPNPNYYQVAPVSRPPKSKPGEVRKLLDVAPDEPLILVTTGGIVPEVHPDAGLKKFSEITFILPGAGSKASRDANLIRLPHQTGYYSPDLVAASDAVIAKLGYSTVAEVFHAGLPFGYIQRPDFPESKPMGRFVQSEMRALELALDAFSCGEWGDLPQKLLDLPRRNPPKVNGAEQIADIVMEKALR